MVKLVGKMMPNFIGSKKPKLIVRDEQCGHKLIMVVILKVVISSLKTISLISCSLMILSFNIKHFSTGWLIKRWYLQQFKLSICFASLGRFTSGNSMRFASSRSSQICLIQRMDTLFLVALLRKAFFFHPFKKQPVLQDHSF